MKQPAVCDNHLIVDCRYFEVWAGSKDLDEVEVEEEEKIQVRSSALVIVDHCRNCNEEGGLVTVPVSHIHGVQVVPERLLCDYNHWKVRMGIQASDHIRG